MRVEALVPDTAPAQIPGLASPHGPDAVLGPEVSGVAQASRGSADAFARLVDAAGAVLAGADRAESAFVAHRGGLQEMVVERARADIALQVAASAAQRTAQALSTLLGMQL